MELLNWSVTGLLQAAYLVHSAECLVYGIKTAPKTLLLIKMIGKMIKNMAKTHQKCTSGCIFGAVFESDVLFSTGAECTRNTVIMCQKCSKYAAKPYVSFYLDEHMLICLIPFESYLLTLCMAACC